MLLPISLMPRRFLQPLQEDNASTGNLGAASDNSLQPTTPSYPKSTERLPELNQKVLHTSHPLSRIPVLETEERKSALQRLSSLKTVEKVETWEKKPQPPSRIPVPQKKRAICNGKSQGLHVAPTSQQRGKATVPSIQKPLQPIRTKRDQTCVVKDIYLHSAKLMKAIHGAKMVAKMPLPPIRARVTVPNNDAKKEPLRPVRPEGSPRPAASKFRRQVVKKHVQFKTLTVQDLPPCPDEMVWEVFDSEAEQVMAYLKAKLISITQELNLIKSRAKMDAPALEEKAAKEQLKKNVEKYIQEICLMKVDSELWEMIRDNEEEEESRKEVMKNGGEEGSVASKPKQTADRRYVSKDRVQVKKSVNDEDEKKDKEVETKSRYGMSTANSDLKQCEHCCRCFHPNRLEKHSENCAKISSNSSRRGLYDSTKHRLKGTEHAGYVKRSVV